MYALDLDQPKRNVFVTQLRDDNEEDHHRLTKYPIVNESADYLMSTGIKTLQSTRLLNVNTKVVQTQKEFDDKKATFRKKMNACKMKEQQLGERQQEIKETINKFDKFIKETESKRRRALERYRAEHKQVVQKTQELETHLKGLEQLRKRHKHLKKKVEKYSIYEKYLMRVLEIIPEDYLTNTSDSMMVSIMMRYKTLTSTNKLLKESLITLTDKIKFHQQIIHGFRQKYNQQLLVSSSQIGTLQHKLEGHIQRNARLEHVFFNQKEAYRKQSSTLGKTRLAVFNIAETCVPKHSQALNRMTVNEMLTLIQNFVVEHQAICQTAELIGSPELVNSPSKEQDKHLVDLQEYGLEK